VHAHRERHEVDGVPGRPDRREPDELEPVVSTTYAVSNPDAEG